MLFFVNELLLEKLHLQSRDQWLCDLHRLDLALWAVMRRVAICPQWKQQRLWMQWITQMSRSAFPLPLPLLSLLLQACPLSPLQHGRSHYIQGILHARQPCSLAVSHQACIAQRATVQCSTVHALHYCCNVHLHNTWSGYADSNACNLQLKHSANSLLLQELHHLRAAQDQEQLHGDPRCAVHAA